MGVSFSLSWEIPLMVWLQSFANDFTIAAAKLFTMLGEEYLLVLVIGFCYWCVSKDLGRRVAMAMSGSMMFGTLIKAVVVRRRPYMDHPEVQCIRPANTSQDIMSVKDQGYSFPSLHASMSAGTYGTIAYNIRKKWTLVLAVVMPFLIGLSRPFLGVHYPTDILAGWGLGLVTLLVLGAIEKRFGYVKAFLVILIIGAAGFFYCRDSEFSAGYGVALGLLLGFCFEEKFVQFTYCRKWWSYVLRPILGMGVFLGISTVLKIPVRGMSLADSSDYLLLYRMFRYMVSTAVTVGVYPLVFGACKNQF